MAAQRAVLITRPEADTSDMADRLVALGYRPVSAPLLKILRRAPKIPSRVQAILVTSGNALAALPPSATPLLAVGNATAVRAQKKGFSKIHSAGRDANALADLAENLLDPKAGPLLLASGARQGLRLADDLRRRGFRVIRRVCYAAQPVHRFPPEAATCLTSGELHAVLFLSAETAAVFVRLLPPEFYHALASVAALAIGKPAADALETLPWLRVCRAENPTLDDVLALI
jgi:uroporphyrinogen-III synthase